MRYADLFSNSIKLFTHTSAPLDIQLLIQEAFQFSPVQFWIKKSDTITDSSALKRFYRYRQRLLKHEPVAYILKRKEFYGEMFYVDNRVLVPRPETEILVQHASTWYTKPFINGEPIRIMDIGAGSGIISIMLAKLTGASVVAVENSKEALPVLKKNINLHDVRVKISFTDLFPNKPEPFDMIISNPPYIPESEWRQLEPQVRDHEPKSALSAGPDGLDVIRGIAHGATLCLKKGAPLIMEIGYNQAESVSEILAENGFVEIAFIDDLSGIPRIVSCTFG